MKVECISKYPSDIQIMSMGSFYRRQSFGVTVGKEYVVLGLSFYINSSFFGTGTVIQYHDDDGNLGFAPIFLFKIIDGRASKYWKAKFYEDGTFLLQPESFYRQYFHDDISDGIKEVIEDYHRITKLLEDESMTVE